MCDSKILTFFPPSPVALCNLVANHPANKRLAKRLSLIGDLASLLKHSEVVETQNAAASCIFNLVCKTDKEELEALGQYSASISLVKT